MSEMHSEIQRHGTMYLISSMGITIIGFLATIFYAHWIGAAVLGAYFLFLSFFSILGFITDLGIGCAGTQRICEGKDPDSFFTASLVLRIGIYALLVLGLIIFQDRFVDLNQTGLFWVLILVVGITTLQTSLGIAIGASNRLGLAASTTLINNIARIVVQVIAVFLGYQVYGLIGGLVVGILLELIIQFKFIDYHLKKFNWSHVKSLLSFSSWATLISAGTTLFDNIPLILIAYFLSVSDVGIYGVCSTFSFFALFISTALVNTLYVKVSRWNAQKDMSAIAISLSRATTYSLIFALPILTGGILLGYNLLYYLYGASFATGATALIIIIAMRVIQSILNLYTNFLMATDHAKQAVVGILAGVSANIILCIMLLPHIGIAGAAIGALVNVIISVFIARTYLSKIIPISLERTPIRHIFIATIVMTISLLILGILPLNQSALQTIMMVLIGAVIYFAVLLKLNQQIRDDAFRTFKIKWVPK
ncbi:MAG: oligosaccharide flippase family protein [Methanoregula sp.]|nr:oligosaccharide flippase family protein [Methanoregula sp.]